VVRYRRVSDRWYRSVAFYAWVVLAPLFLVFRVSVVNWHNVLGPPALALDLFGLFLVGTYISTTRRLQVPVHRPTDVSRYVVDCLIPTHREVVALLEPTIIAATRVRGIRNVLVLGNYERAEVRDMCRRLGVGYFPRGTNDYAKAGNLNNGLRHTDADFVMVLDADHMPRPEFLERTLGYLDDPRIAYVQAPQTYYNDESFLFQPMHGRRGGWTELQPFYYCAQLAKNGWEAALFVGSTAVLRRSALDEVGGFAQGTPTEDIHTSLRLHARGWKAVFTPELLAFGLEAANMREYHTQRNRWAAGTLNLLFLSPDSPLRARGLSPIVRLNFLYGICVHLAGPLRLGNLLLPVLCLYTLVSPVTVTFSWYGPIFLGYLVLLTTVTQLHSRGSSHLVYSDAYSYGASMATLTGARGVFLRQRHFASSRKIVTRADTHWSKWALYLLLAVSMGAVVRGGYLGLTGRFSGLVFWSALYATLNCSFLTVFLVLLYRYEHAEVRAPHAALEGVAKYDYVMRRLLAGAIGPPPQVLNRPLEPVEAPRRRGRKTAPVTASGSS
jgi:cellulose synthase/poly-beta-1,6-N-acetylglucosamine synthase-like glycosyltransferase